MKGLRRVYLAERYAKLALDSGDRVAHGARGEDLLALDVEFSESDKAVNVGRHWSIWIAPRFSMLKMTRLLSCGQ